jgi:hypothetical protein
MILRANYTRNWITGTRLRNGSNITVIRVENGFEGCGEIFDHQIFN